MRASATLEQPRLRYVYCGHKNEFVQVYGARGFDYANSAHLRVAPSPFAELDANIVVVDARHVGHLAARAGCLRLQGEPWGHEYCVEFQWILLCGPGSGFASRVQVKAGNTSPIAISTCVYELICAAAASRFRAGSFHHSEPTL